MQGIVFNITVEASPAGLPIESLPIESPSSTELTEEASRIHEIAITIVPTFFTHPVDLLFYLCKKGGTLKDVASLLNRGVDLNARSKHNTTPLLEAIKNGKLVIAHFLLNASADPTLIDDQGKTALHYLLCNDYVHPDFIDRLIENGTNINSQDKEGNTPLHYAYLLQASKNLIRYLIHKGANPNIKNHIGDYPANMALGKL